MIQTPKISIKVSGMTTGANKVKTAPATSDLVVGAVFFLIMRFFWK